MADFDFNTVPKIISRLGAARQLGEIVQSCFDVQKVLVVTDGGLVTNGLLEPGLAALKDAGFDVELYSKVVADPPEETILDLADVASRRGELVIGFGGGSSMDAAKLAAALADGKQPLKEMYGVGNITVPRRPLLQIPTTSGTGSEVTPISIVTTGETTKSGVVSPVLYADVALLDAELTLGLPPSVTAATGIDAMVHAIEAYTSRHKKNPLSDTLALQALRLLYHHLPIAYENGDDLPAREKCMLGAMLAGQAFANAPVAAVHALAYPLGGIFHLSHGLSNALVLPHVLRFNMTEAEDHYAELCAHLFGSQGASAEKFVEKMEALCETVGVRKKLRDFGIDEKDTVRLAEDAMLQTRLLVNNPRDVTYEDALRIYEQAW